MAYQIVQHGDILITCQIKSNILNFTHSIFTQNRTNNKIDFLINKLVIENAFKYSMYSIYLDILISPQKIL